MTKRITPEEVRGLANVIEGDSTGVALALRKLADQMEDDKECRQLLWNRIDRLQTERDTFAAKVQEYLETLKWIAECGVDYQSINRARSVIGEEETNG